MCTNARPGAGGSSAAVAFAQASTSGPTQPQESAEELPQPLSIESRSQIRAATEVP